MKAIMALSSERVERKFDRRRAPPSVAPPSPPSSGAGITQSDPLRVLAPPPDGAEVAKHPVLIVPPDVQRLRDTVAPGSSVEASKVPVLDTVPQRKNFRFGWLIILFLLLVLGGTLYYLIQTTRLVPETLKHSVKNGLVAAITRINGWVGQAIPSKTPTRMTRNALVTNLANCTPPPTVSSLAAPIRQTQSVIAKVQATREEFPKFSPPAHQVQMPLATLPLAPVGKHQKTDNELRAAPSAAPLPSEPAGEKKVAWPEVAVSAIVGNGRRGGAIINGDLIMVDEENDEGLMLDHIESQATVLKFQGETRRFSIKKR